MIRWVTFPLILVLFAAGAAQGRGLEVKKALNDYQVTVKLEKNPPVQGEKPSRGRNKGSAGKIDRRCPGSGELLHAAHASHGSDEL